MTFIILIVAVIVLYLAIQIYIRKGIVERPSRTSFSTDPGLLKPKRALLRDLSPGLYPHTLSWKLHREQLRIRIFIARQLWFADSNPAVVVHENPFIIAAYAADCDAVLLVRFLPESVEELRQRRVVLRLGARLLSINTFFPPGEEWKGDEIVLGPHQTHRWSSFRPFIAEFMCGDMQTIERRKADFPPELWERTKKLGLAAVQKADLDQVRWGNPMLRGGTRFLPHRDFTRQRMEHGVLSTPDINSIPLRPNIQEYSDRPRRKAWRLPALLRTMPTV